MDWTQIITPINVDQLKTYLDDSNYDKKKAVELILGFSQGFDIGYRGPINRRDQSQNLPLKIGMKTDLWNKVMKEVAVKRYAGPYHIDQLPFDCFMQSPIGLVPKANNKTRLIFHLSYDFGQKESQRSLNYHTPKELCTVKYRDLDHAIKGCLELLQQVSGLQKSQLVYAKSDCSNTFHILPILVSQCSWLVLMAIHPTTGEKMYFVDLCLLFGASISCARFQAFSDALKFILDWKLAKQFLHPPWITNYLDDFLFIALLLSVCDGAVDVFLEICGKISCPISLEKTERANALIVFLGILIDGINLVLSIPLEKCRKARELLMCAIAKRKVTVKFVQKLTGTLNFLNKAIIPGRAFTRRMYSRIAVVDKKGFPLKQHHHVWLPREFVLDCRMWLTFLENCRSTNLCRPFVDFDMTARTSQILNFYSDASRDCNLGFGAIFENQWFAAQWSEQFIEDSQPSIEFLELLALVAVVLTWSSDDKLCDSRVTIFSDNESVFYMANNTSSTCHQCMKLIQLLVLDNIKHNRKIHVQHIRSWDNYLADSLSRLDFKRFWKLAPKSMNKIPSSITPVVWPVEDLWNDEINYLAHFQF